MHSHSWSSSEHKTSEHQHRSPSTVDHREHRSGSENRSHHSEGRGHSREPLKESRSRPPSQQGSKASPANSTHSGHSPLRKDKEKEISPFSDEDLVRGRYESSKKWPHPDDSHSKHKRPHSKKRPGMELTSSLYSKKHHRDERTSSGHRGGGGNSEWKNTERGQVVSRGGTPERKEKRVPPLSSHYHHLPPSDSLLHESSTAAPYSSSRDGPTFNGKGDLRRRSYESISDEDMSYVPSREGSQERKSSYDVERLSKKDRKRRLTDYTDSSEEDHHTSVVGGSESRPPASSVVNASLGARTKHKKHKYSKEHKESWRKSEHGKEGSSSNKHKHVHHHHKR